jgi:hypothetical protein
MAKRKRLTLPPSLVSRPWRTLEGYERQVATLLTRRKQWIADGKCNLCAQPNSDPRFKGCPDCRSFYAAKTAARRAERKKLQTTNT